MDISSLTNIPLLTGRGSTGVSGSTKSSGQTAVKPESITPDVSSTNGSAAGANTTGKVYTRPSEPLANAYVVSDQRFTIFKDSLGYVTKYTSLVDGRVTYIPDQDLARFLEAQRQARVDIDA